LKQAAFDYFSIARKGKDKTKAKDIEGGMVATDEPNKMQGNIKNLIEVKKQSNARSWSFTRI
jgi:hypothetical protein